jgi:hypothetical protein
MKYMRLCFYGGRGKDKELYLKQLSLDGSRNTSTYGQYKTEER